MSAEAEHGALYRQHLFDPYKLVVKMADRVSARRMQANTFFLTVNSALLIVIASLMQDGILPGFFGTLPIVALLVFCYAWWRIVRSYRQRNSGRFAVILAMETLLPAAPLTAKRMALGEGKVRKRCLPLSQLENRVPCMFFSLLSLLLLTVAVLNGGQGPVAAGG